MRVLLDAYALLWFIWGHTNLSAKAQAIMADGSNDLPVLPISVKHAAALTPLPLHPRDPFDRLLVAQAMVEQVPIVSGDPALDGYPVARLW